MLLLAAIVSIFQGTLIVVSYVTNQSVFPRPLSAQDEAKHIEAFENGCEDARNVLIERNLRLVAHVVKKFDNTGEPTDDLISIGTIGLIKAINTFNRHRNTRLATYAARCIENEILMHLRSTKRLRHEVLLHDPIGSDKEGNEITLMDVIATDLDIADRVERQIEHETMVERLGTLSNREQKVLALRYGLAGGMRKTQREISRLLGISRSYVSRIEKKALGKLQRSMSS